MRWSRRGILLLAVGLGLGASAAKADGDDDELLPRLGETTAEYEARQKGLPASPRSEEVANSVAVSADKFGRYFTEASVNGNSVHVRVDTGADVVSLTREDARAVGLNVASSDFTAKFNTANGPVMVAPVVLKEVMVGGIAVHDVRAVVNPEHTLAISLLGMSFLSKLSSFNVSEGRLVLTP